MNQEKIWSYFQNEGQEHFKGADSRLTAIARRLRSGQRVLNIGVGAGVFERIAVVRNLDIYSLDPDSAAVERIRHDLVMGEKAQVGYCQSIPFGGEMFDAVIMSEVIEHLTPEVTQAALLEVKRVLKPDGRLIGTVPSRENLAQQHVVCPCCGNKFHRWGHVQTFDVSNIRALISPLLLLEELSTRYFPSWSTLQWNGKLEAAILLSLKFLGIRLSNETIFFAARKT